MFRGDKFLATAARLSPWLLSREQTTLPKKSHGIVAVYELWTIGLDYKTRPPTQSYRSECQSDAKYNIMEATVILTFLPAAYQPIKIHRIRDDRRL